MRINQPRPKIYTHEGTVAQHINPELSLRRSVMSCMLWEKEFYEDGEDITKRIADLIPKVDPEKVAAIAVEAREKMKLRHIPLFIVREMARLPSHRTLVRKTLSTVIQRPDELSEFLAIYWKDKKQPISSQVKKGLADAFQKFNEYQLAKYNRDGSIKLRDVLFLCHAKPKDAEQEALWKKLVDKELQTPDTWEVALSSGGDKKEHWTRLLSEQKLGALALLRNLRNMRESNVEPTLIKSALKEMKTERILPFRFIAAARHAMDFEPELEQAMFKCLSGMEKFPGSTCVLVDVSGSMDAEISSKSDLKRVDAACGIAMLIRELSDDPYMVTFSDLMAQVPPRRGFALRDAIVSSQPHSGTTLGQALRALADPRQPKMDRMIVITDEQSSDRIPNPPWEHSYIINVASNKNGVGYGAWNHIDGWSESVISYIAELERSED